jgi:hypothetical protein
LVLEQVDGERPGTVTVEFIGDELVYSNARGVVVRRTTVPPPAVRHGDHSVVRIDFREWTGADKLWQIKFIAPPR